MNIELLRKVQAAIRAEPKQFDMDAWFSRHKLWLNDHEYEPIPNCGTTACIAGWAVAIHNKMNPAQAHGYFGGMGMSLTARDVLGLPSPSPTDYEAHDPGYNLFHSSQWPEPFRSEFGRAERKHDYNEMADIACRRIDHFIATEGRE